MKTWVIGDIHGGLRALTQVLDRAPIEAKDHFIFLGDYVDGWSDNLNTLDFLMEFSEQFKCTFLRGNHDDLLLRYLTQQDDNPMWLAHGGAATKKNYDSASDAIIKKHIQFLKTLQFYHIDDENRLFVHAGFSNVKGPQYEYFKVMVYWDRSLWELAQCVDPTLTPEDSNYPNRLKLFHEIYIGHTPVSKTEKCNPKKCTNVWNLDTGAAYKGALTLMNIDTKEVWQSDPVHRLYPSEKGRN